MNRIETSIYCNIVILRYQNIDLLENYDIELVRYHTVGYRNDCLVPELYIVDLWRFLFLEGELHTRGKNDALPCGNF